MYVYIRIRCIREALNTFLNNMKRILILETRESDQLLMIVYKTNERTLQCKQNISVFVNLLCGGNGYIIINQTNKFQRISDAFSNCSIIIIVNDLM